MRAIILLLTLSAAALLPSASAVLSHGECGASTLSVGNSADVDVWANNECVGAATWFAPNPVFTCNGLDVHQPGLFHVLLLWSSYCANGALVGLP